MITKSLIENYADIFKALSNPKRLQIFLELMENLEPGLKCESDVDQAEACQLDMAKRLGIAPSTLSHHIKELKHVGLITLHRTGRNVSIEIDIENVKLLKNFLQK